MALLALVAAVHADMYFHNPRGSNNRLDEARRDRNNANRLFDSQNNDRGGYNVGSLYYYEGSILPLEWTNQHSCADQNNLCEVVVQYMCGDLVRDGATTNTIPENPAQCENLDCNTDLEYGMHENFNYYLDCRLRQRNTGLFTADRNLRGQTARFTRQNEQGTRRGYECPEERDYYPYWHPTPWRDVIVFTNNASRCNYYRQESANVKSRFSCVLPEGFINENLRSRNPVIPNTEEECIAIEYDDGSVNGTTGMWVESLPASGLSPPECIETVWSRDNHLGNTIGGFPAYYNWTVPNDPNEHCVLRIRYNISTLEYEAWDSGVNSSLQRVREDVFDGVNNDGEDDINREQISELDVWSRFNFNFMEAAARGYVFRQNPVVKVFPDIGSDSRNFGLQLAINTNQFGRTFQDRSHTFAIRSRPQELEGVTIYNLNVRGKRGNIVQVYPGVEYDFVPNRLIASRDSYIHIQWTGSNTNPNNNDGQGRAGTDRSNFVLLRDRVYEEGNGNAESAAGPVLSHWARNYPAFLDANSTFLGLDRADRQALAVLDTFQFGGEMSELDDAGTYFDLAPRKVTQIGTYYYLCTRNNNFTNRSQKGKIIVQENAIIFSRVGTPGGTIEVNDHSVMFEEGDLMGAVVFRLEEFSEEEDAMQAAQERGGTIDPPPEIHSSFVLLDPFVQFTAENEEAEIVIDLPGDPPSGSRIYRASPQSDWSFVGLETEVVDGRALASTNQGGIFVVASQPNVALIAGLSVFGFVMFLILLSIAGLVVYFILRRDKWQKTKQNVYKAKMKVTRSFAKQV